MDKLRLFVWRPHTTIILIVGLVLILVGLVVSFTISTFKPTTEVRLGSGAYSLWLADTDPTRIQGLSGVEKLRPNGGLLMAFDHNSTHGIWMKDMKFPLDIIWLDSNKKVVYIVKNAPVEDPVQTIYTPKDTARYVLELPAGSVNEAGIKTGDIADFEMDVQ
ncbi:MAG: hypothetical protein JWO54_576 [Candidatus Saccharibacteria bacterium]|nr:hypothetical protein [Candidatus Saccharibacteria bacterium]MDB5180763.1 hypothetical protein [Candidatus Saccharibacteria bacterium]MDB5180816.1 hypothetical protein [Candidatus Saccharibacteria bacterium]